MKRGQVVAALSLVVVAAAIAWLFATAPRPPQPDLSSAASSAQTETPPTPTPTPASTVPTDPSHRGGVTFCALNPAVAEATIEATICVTGWTATIRPPESYTEALKPQQMSAERLAGAPSGYEEDHRVPLELGGAPGDPTNLSPEPHSSSFAKDAAENAARREVCGGEDLRAVQAAFVATWLGPYPTYGR